LQKFYMTVGLPGSGKSHYAASIPNTVVHSSDSIRKELLGNDSDQTNQDLVFRTLYNRVLADLEAGKNVVYDATNIKYKRRMQFLQNVRALKNRDISVECIFTAVPYNLCLENNASRERTVPEEVIKRMHENIDIPMIAEGWDCIHIKGDSPAPNKIVDTLLKHLCDIEHDNPHHQFNIGQHSLITWAIMKSKYPDASPALIRAALLHDIGKESTKVFTDRHGNPSESANFYYHEKVGAYDSFAYTTDMSDYDRLTTALLIRWHMWPYVVKKSQNPNITARKVRQLLGEDIWNQIMILNKCDRNAH